MRVLLLLMLCHVAMLVLADEEANTKDIAIDDQDYLDEERRHRRRKKRPNNNSPCGSGRTFEKLFGFHHQTPSTYVSAPVMNYFFGCGGGFPSYPAQVPVPVPVHLPAPVPQYPSPLAGHNHFHNHGGNVHGGGVPYSQPYNQQVYNQPAYSQQAYNQPTYNQLDDQRPQRPQRPLQGTFTAAASGFGSALADYLTGGRPNRVYKMINKSVNQLFKPFYRIF